MVFPPLWGVFTVHESCHQVKSTLLDDIQKIMQEGDSREKVAAEHQLSGKLKFHAIFCRF